MEVTERQKKLLEEEIEEYIDSAQPVSSEAICQDFNISSATARNEMQELTGKGYLYQPHVSAGRIPTDKGYRFFVDSFCLSGKKPKLDKRKYFGKDKDTLRLSSNITKALASDCSGLIVFYSEKEDFIYKQGWEKILQEPEFKESDFIADFIKMANAFEKQIKSFLNKDSLSIYIGEENKLPQCDDFTIILSNYHMDISEEDGLLALLGPKRMPYQKNIQLMSILTKLLKDY